MSRRAPERDDLKVFISSRESTCGECGEDLGTKAWITLTKEKAALCLSCADLDYLVSLPSVAAAKAFDEQAIHLAVVAHIRHVETRYDELLMCGWDRIAARQSVEDTIQSVLSKWRADGGL